MVFPVPPDISSVFRLKPKCVVIDLRTNDLAMSEAGSVTAERLRSLASSCLRQGASVIVILSIVPRQTGLKGTTSVGFESARRECIQV